MSKAAPVQRFILAKERGGVSPLTDATRGLEGQPVRIARLARSLFVVSVLLTGTSLCGADEMGAASPTNSLFEEFKAFVESPPPIEELVYSVKLLANPSKPELGVGGSRHFQIYRASWQTNAWLVRGIARPDAPAEDKRLFGRGIFVAGDKYWHLDQRKGAILWIDDDPIIDGVKIELPRKMVNQTKAVAEYLRSGLYEVLNAGVANVPPGSIRWVGNRFKTEYSERQQTIEGELFPTPDGRASHMDVSYSSGSNNTSVRIEYEYGTNASLALFPTRIRTFRLENQQEVLHADVAVASVKPAMSGLPESVFDGTPYIATNRLAILYYTNGALFELNSRGQFVVAKEETPHLHKPKRPNPPLFYTVATGTTAAFFVLVFRTKRSENANQRNKR